MSRAASSYLRKDLHLAFKKFSRDNMSTFHATTIVLLIVYCLMCPSSSFYSMPSTQAVVYRTNLLEHGRSLNKFRFMIHSIPSKVSELLPDEFFDNKDAQASDIASSSSSNAQSNGILQNRFEVVMKKLGKCSKQSLRTLIKKYDENSLPVIDNDLETHITVALETLWKQRNGDWDGLVQLVSEELDADVQLADEYLIKCVQNGKNISESR